MRLPSVIMPFLLTLMLTACGYPTRPSSSSSLPAATESHREPAASTQPEPLAADPDAVGPTWDPERDPTETPPDVDAPPAYATREGSGLASYVLKEGNGVIQPGSRSEVTVHYAGWNRQGQLFDSSHSRGEPATFPLNGVIAGWTEGVQLMVEGEVRRFWIPANLAYGNSGAGGRPSGMLVFDVELISIDRP